MRRDDARTVKERLSSIFLRKGAEGAHTGLFDRLTTAQKEILLRGASLGDQELPILGSARDANNWTLVTTERLVWCLDKKHGEIGTDKIDEISIDLSEVTKDPRAKLEVEYLQVTTTTGLTFQVYVEAGAPLSGVWSALRNLGLRNLRARATRH